MNSKLKSIVSSVGVFGGCALYLVLAIGLLVVFFSALNFLTGLANILAAIGLLALIPLGLVAILAGRARRFCGNGVVLVSYFLGASTWLTATVYLSELWGATAVVIGVLMFGIGSVPLGLIALLLHGQFRIAFMLLGQLVLVYALRALGIWIESKITNHKQVLDRSAGGAADGSVGSDLPCNTESEDRIKYVVGSPPSRGDREVSIEDLNAIRAYGRHLAMEWWRNGARQVAACDLCNEPVLRNGGFVVDSDLYCESCFDPRSDPDEALKNLRVDPDYYGEGLLKKAKQFARTVFPG